MPTDANSKSFLFWIGTVGWAQTEGTTAAAVSILGEKC